MHPTRVLGAVLLVVTLPLMFALGALGALGYEKAGRFDYISEWDPSRTQPSYEVRGEKAVTYWAHAGDAFPLAQVFAPTAHSFAFRPVERLQQSLADEQAPRQNRDDYEWVETRLRDFREDLRDTYWLWAAAFGVAGLGGLLALLKWPRLGAVVLVGAGLTGLATRELYPLAGFLVLLVPSVLALFLLAPPLPIPVGPDDEALRQYAQGLARLVGPSLGGKPLTVSLSAGYLVAMIFAGGVTMGLGALVLWFNARHWPALIDPEGITDRAGHRYLWSELQTLRRVIVKSRGGGEVSRRVELTFPQGRVHLAPNGLQRSRELSDVFVLLFPPQLRR